ncbi:MAG TPA: HEAT repeat domain-containing protein [Chitinophagaceae bacterium]|nr:HEAT repeat domain-containing protein [Chitinophagaceae bacterium]
MAFYDLPKAEREQLSRQIQADILQELQTGTDVLTLTYCNDEDTYIRKAAYLGIGRLFLREQHMSKIIINKLVELAAHPGFRVRQTAINAAGEIGKTDFGIVQSFFDKSLFDPHHSPRNAVIGSIKKMGEVNPVPVLAWAKTYLQHPDKEIRREICHGIELRGRKYPQDILPLLQELQLDRTARVRHTLVHVIGQIAYKKGCLHIVLDHLQHWNNKDLVRDALEEIIDVHERYRQFAAMTQEEAIAVIDRSGLRL